MENEAWKKAGQGPSELAIARETLQENEKTNAEDWAMGGESRHKMRGEWRNRCQQNEQRGWTKAEDGGQPDFERVRRAGASKSGRKACRNDNGRSIEGGQQRET